MTDTPDNLSRLADALVEIELLTATGNGLDPDTTMRVHLLAGAGRAVYDDHAWHVEPELSRLRARVEELESRLSERRNMHRRAQRAEGRLSRAMHIVKLTYTLAVLREEWTLARRMNAVIRFSRSGTGTVHDIRLNIDDIVSDRVIRKMKDGLV